MRKKLKEQEEKHTHLSDNDGPKGRARKGEKSMDALQFIFEPAHLAIIVGAILCLAWAIRYGFLPSILKHRERIQELRNEELRLELQIIQANKAQVKQDLPPAPDQPTSREVSSEEGTSAAYQMGYKQQQSS